MLAILTSNEFRQNYHRALNRAGKTPAAQRSAARKAVEEYFSLNEVASNSSLNSRCFYFADQPIEVLGTYKFLIPGTIDRRRIAGPLFQLTPKAASSQRLLEAKQFDRAIAAVEAVRLTLVPERVNGILSFIADAKRFYANGDAASTDRAIRTALDHFNRAATEGLARIKSDAERGKRSNEIAGMRRTFADLRKMLQAEIASRIG